MTYVSSCAVELNDFGSESVYPPVADFYANRSVLITGGTGFLGKVLLEKMLFNCTNIDKIYLLIRDKKKINGSERLDTMLKLPLFQRLRENQPEQLKKIVPVSGDVTKVDLGVNSKDADAIMNEVSVVFHAAASIKFNDTLSNLLNHNVNGTRNIIDFCTKIKNLKVFAYVSSSYSQSDKKHIEEKIYPLPVTLDEVNQVAVSQNKDQEAAILNGKPNNYTLTKALAEDVVVQSHLKNNLPAIIFRPSIISAVYKDGLPGWVDNWAGASRLITTISKGLCHVIRGQKTNIIDLIPVDYVASTLIVAVTKYPSDSESVPVYNICSSSANPVTISEIVKNVIESSRQQKNNVIPMGVVVTESNVLLKLASFWYETVPSNVIDFIEKLRRRKPWYSEILQQIERQREVLDAFTNNSWIITSSNTENLTLSVSPEDRQLYQLDIKNIDWNEYLSIYVEGLTKFMLKAKK